MAYFPDLSEYTYLTQGAGSRGRLLNIGWLDAEHSYPTGGHDGALLATLARLSATPVNRTRGYHDCGLCEVRSPIFVDESGGCMTSDSGEDLWTPPPGTAGILGDAEIHVPGPKGITFAAPTLIVHYIGEHGYRPPSEFVDAVADLVRSRTRRRIR